MSAFLVDTLVWTGALLALVLLIRRPVAAIFGPKAAYALWALPMARLLLPPLVLPAWMAPAVDAPPMPQPMTSGTYDSAFDTDHALVAGAPLDTITDAGAIAHAPASLLGDLLQTLAAFDWISLLLPLWLAGAAVFLVRRYALYFRMRADLLAPARPVGEAGRVRLVETPAADGPVAFGVIDKVVALPPGFMASRDRAARDLALAHELAHHRGGDLVCNMLIQPLFALHWFNPLSLLGWRALRRDQEAACDARVVANQPRERRAAYAAVIARFATQPRHAGRLALAAPMACPVLGDRSIIQRLRSLTMTDISARRRWSGRVLIGAAALAVPLTASISYAQGEAQIAPIAPIAPPAAPQAPAAPASLRAPSAPAAPEAGDTAERRIVRIERVVSDGEGDAGERRVVREVYRRDGHEMTAEERAEFESEMKQMRAELAREQGELQRELRERLGENGELQRELRAQFAENGELQRGLRQSLAVAHSVAATAVANAPRVVMGCRPGQREVSETVTNADGHQVMTVCQSIATAEARRARGDARRVIALARAEVARTRELTESQRAEALRSLDEAERATRAQ